MRGVHGVHGLWALPCAPAPGYAPAMVHQNALTALLGATRDGNSEWRALYDEFVGTLRRTGVAANAPRPGDVFPSFALPDAAGRYRSLDALLASGPVVLSFNRGGWCPYCAHELRAWNEALPELTDAGGRFVAITPEVGGRAALMGRLLDLSPDAELLCDVDLGVALACGLAFRMGEPMLRRYRDHGLDLAELYGSASGFMPVPATYVLDEGGVVRFAFADPDFRVRADPAAAIAIVRALGR